MATLRVDEINKILRERIEQYNRKVGIENIGRVVQVGDGIARIIGLGEIMSGELVEFAEGTRGITVALALLTSAAYFYAGLSKKGLSYFEKYIKPTPILLPINILEDFTKPLSLSFRLFGNILADELVVVVLVSLVPLVVPIPVMFLGLFTSGIQALIFATLAAAYIGESMEGHH